MLRQAPSRPDAGVASQVCGIRLPASGIHLPASGIHLPASGIHLPASGMRLPAFGIDLPASGIDLPASGIHLPASGADLPASGIRLPASGIRLPASACAAACGMHLPASGMHLPASGMHLPASGIRLPASGIRLPASGMHYANFVVTGGPLPLSGACAGRGADLRPSAAGLPVRRLHRHGLGHQPAHPPALTREPGHARFAAHDPEPDGEGRRPAERARRARKWSPCRRRRPSASCPKANFGCPILGPRWEQPYAWKCCQMRSSWPLEGSWPAQTVFTRPLARP